MSTTVSSREPRQRVDTSERAHHAHRASQSPQQTLHAPQAPPPMPRILPAGPVHLIDAQAPAGAVVDPAAPEITVYLVLSTPPLLQLGFNRAPQWLAMSPGVMLATPPDTACDFIGEGPSHVLGVAIPKARVAEFVEDSGVRVEIRHEEAFRQPRLAQQITRLWHAIEDDAPASSLFADQVMREILHALALRTASDDSSAGSASDANAAAAEWAFAQRRRRDASERLPAQTLRRLRDFVESGLADDLDVGMMANVAALSPAHFARAFVATLGITPFHYVMARRLARGHELLRRTNRSVVTIALDVGFKTPSHFTSRFRQEFGVTPIGHRSSFRKRIALP
jgi:AraC family transcriptional regulator